MIEFGQFLGPLGGLLCIAWAMGAISGYAFFSRAIHALHKRIYEDRIRQLEYEIAAIRRRQSRRIVQQRADQRHERIAAQ